MKIAFLPGFLVDAAVRTIAAILSGSKLRRLTVLQRGPLLRTEPPPVRHVGPAIWVFVRLGLLFVLLFTVLMSYPTLIEAPLHLPIYRPEDLQTGSLDIHPLRHFVDQLTELPRNLHIHRAQGWVLLYVAIGALISAALPGRELIAALYCLLLAHCTAFVFSWLGVKFGFLSRGQLIGIFYSDHFWGAFSLLFILTALAAMTLAVIRLGALALPRGESKEKKS
ncbi:MAG: hypothetical protein KDC38_08975 [Planctomycetes bacterium]|nr:hypothetical protein [Planctomycetota bacterium]